MQYSPEIEYSQATPPTSLARSQPGGESRDGKELIPGPAREANQEVKEQVPEVSERSADVVQRPIDRRQSSATEEDCADIHIRSPSPKRSVAEVELAENSPEPRPKADADGEDIEDSLESLNDGPWVCDKCTSENPKVAMTCEICNLGVSPAWKRQFEEKKENDRDMGLAKQGVDSKSRMQISFTKGTRNGKRPRSEMGNYFSDFVDKRKAHDGGDEKVVEGFSVPPERKESRSADFEGKHSGDGTPGEEEAEMDHEITDVLAKNVKELKDELRLYSMRLSGRKPELQVRLLAVRMFHYKRGDWRCSECHWEHENSAAPICRKCNTIRTLGSPWECGTCEHDNPHGLRCEECNALRLNIPAVKLEGDAIENAEEAFTRHRERRDQEMDAESEEMSKSVIPFGQCELDLPNRKVPSFIACRISGTRGKVKKRGRSSRARHSSSDRPRKQSDVHPVEPIVSRWGGGKKRNLDDVHQRSKKVEAPPSGAAESPHESEEDLKYEDSDDDILHNESFDDEEFFSLSKEMGRLPKRKSETGNRIKVTESEILAEEKKLQKNSKTKVTSLKALLGDLDDDSESGSDLGMGDSCPEKASKSKEFDKAGSNTKDSQQKPAENRVRSHESPTNSSLDSSQVCARVLGPEISSAWRCSRSDSESLTGAISVSESSQIQQHDREKKNSSNKPSKKSPDGSPKLDLEAMLFDESSSEN